MEEKEKLSLTSPIDELEQRIMCESDTEELKNIIDLFNLQIKKKDIVRTSKLSDLQDKISAQIESRIDKHSDEFSNQDLISYFKTIQDTINKSDTTLDSIKMPVIQINKQEVNVNVDNGLSKESRNKVADIINIIMKKYNKPSVIENVEYEEKKDENE